MARPIAIPLRAGENRQPQRSHGMSDAVAQNILAALAVQTRAIEANTQALAAIAARLPERKATDQEKFAKLVAAIEDHGEFTAMNLLDAATLPGREKMRVAIVAVIGSSPEDGVRRFARFLSRHAGESAGDLRLERIGRSGQGARYRVLHVFHSNIGPRGNGRGIRARMKGKTP